MRPIKNNKKNSSPTSELSYGTPHTLAPVYDTRNEVCSCERERLRNIFYEANLHVWRYQYTTGNIDPPTYRAWDASDPSLAQIDTTQAQADADIEAGYYCRACMAKNKKRWWQLLSWKQWMLLTFIISVSFGLGVLVGFGLQFY
ncbi:hypothetical protein BZA77DRAFT_354279 [Pyronema omphalodes]|nr:hypothetical protein BZA77DRAFT_354279 [Pyronema omphalodes]